MELDVGVDRLTHLTYALEMETTTTADMTQAIPGMCM